MISPSDFRNSFVTNIAKTDAIDARLPPALGSAGTYTFVKTGAPPLKGWLKGGSDEHLFADYPEITPTVVTKAGDDTKFTVDAVTGVTGFDAYMWPGPKATTA